jgi:hypothetical protein
MARQIFYWQRMTIHLLLGYFKALLAFNEASPYLMIFISPSTPSSHRGTSISISFVMASELSLQALLITMLLFALIARFCLLWVFGENWPLYKVDLSLYVLFFLLSAVLTGLFWSEKPSI